MYDLIMAWSLPVWLGVIFLLLLAGVVLSVMDREWKWAGTFGAGALILFLAVVAVVVTCPCFIASPEVKAFWMTVGAFITFGGAIAFGLFLALMAPRPWK